MAGIIKKVEEFVHVFNNLAKVRKWSAKYNLEEGVLTVRIRDNSLGKEHVEKIIMNEVYSINRTAEQIELNALKLFRQSMSIMEKLGYIRDAIIRYCDDVKLEWCCKGDSLTPGVYTYRFLNRRTNKCISQSVNLEPIQDIKVFVDSLIDRVNRELIVPEHTPEKRYITTASPLATEASRFRKEMEAMINSPKQKLTGSLTTGYHYGTAMGAMYIDEIMSEKKKLDDRFDALMYGKEIHMRFGKNGYRVIPEIKNVIFNNPATIVMWGDGTKTVVKAVDEEFDEEKGLAMAIAKKCLGNEGKYFNEFRKWLPEKKEKTVSEGSCGTCAYSAASPIDEPCTSCLGEVERVGYKHETMMTVSEVAKALNISPSSVRSYIRNGKFKGVMKVDGKWMIPFDKVER